WRPAPPFCRTRTRRAIGGRCLRPAGDSPVRAATEGGVTMAKVIFGNHSSVLVSRQDRDSICKFYCDVLGGKVMKADPERDFIRLGEDFYIVFLYGDVADESEFLRSARSVWLEIKSDNVEEMTRKIL